MCIQKTTVLERIQGSCFFVRFKLQRKNEVLFCVDFFLQNSCFLLT